MKYQESQSISGKWLKGSDVESGSQATLISETKPSLSQFKAKDGSPKMRDVAKILFEGSTEPINVSINRASLNALIRAFGNDSVNWQNKPLTVMTEKVVVAGKRVTAVYLVPDGYAMGEDANGYVVISNGGDESVEAAPIEDVEF